MLIQLTVIIFTEMIYKGYEIMFDKKKLLGEYQIRSNANLLKTITFKKNNIQAINKALAKAKKYIDSL